MKKFVKTIIGSVVLGGLVLGVIASFGWLVNWLCADSGRFVLGMIIGIYGIYRMFKAEFGE